MQVALVHAAVNLYVAEMNQFVMNRSFTIILHAPVGPLGIQFG